MPIHPYKLRHSIPSDSRRRPGHPAPSSRSSDTRISSQPPSLLNSLPVVSTTAGCREPCEFARSAGPPGQDASDTGRGHRSAPRQTPRSNYRQSGLVGAFRLRTGLGFGCPARPKAGEGYRSRTPSKRLAPGEFIFVRRFGRWRRPCGGLAHGRNSRCCAETGPGCGLMGGNKHW
jgi:hypothetical protein